MQVFERTDWCEVCQAVKAKACIVVVHDDGRGVIVCRDCVRDWAEHLGILQEVQDDILEAVR